MDQDQVKAEKNSGGEALLSLDSQEQGLAGRELVAAVGSRVMGWRVFDINDVRDDEWRDDPANYPYLEQYVGTALYTSRGEFRLWNPDTDIAAAMEVVERAQRESVHVTMSNSKFNCFTNELLPEGSEWQVIAGTPDYFCCETNALLSAAICRAILDVLGLNAPAGEGITTKP